MFWFTLSLHNPGNLQCSTDPTEVVLSRCMVVKVLWRPSHEEVVQNPRDKCHIQEQWIGVAVTILLTGIYTLNCYEGCSVQERNRSSSQQPGWPELKHCFEKKVFEWTWVCGFFLPLKTGILITFLQNEARFGVLASQSCCCLLQLRKDQTLSTKKEDWGGGKQIGKKLGETASEAPLLRAVIWGDWMQVSGLLLKNTSVF